MKPRFMRMRLGLVIILGAHALSTQIQATQQPEQPAQLAPVDPRVQVRTYVLPETNETMPYALFVSSKVTRDKKNPLIVALHGRGRTHETLVRTTYRAVELADQGGYILVAPMGYNSAGWYGTPFRAPANGNPPTPQRGLNVGNIGTAVSDPVRMRELSEKDVMNVLAMVRKEFNIDERRTYLMGHSMGGAGTLHLGVKYSSNWAAIAAIAPAAGSLNPDSLGNVKDMPVIIVQGDSDASVPVGAVRGWAEKLKELKMTHEYHEIAGGDHDSVIATGMPDIFAFFARHAKPASR